MTNRMDIFARTFNRRHPSRVKTYYVQLPIPADDSIQNLLATAHAAGMSIGSAGRAGSGIFEIQTDAGIWSADDGGKLTLAHARFETWEQLESN